MASKEMSGVDRVLQAVLLEPETKPLGQHLREVRLAQSQTLQQLTQFLGCSTAFLCAVESGHKRLPFGMLEQLCRYWNLNEEQTRYFIRLQRVSSAELRIDLTTLSTRQRLGLDRLVQYFLEVSGA